MRSYKDRVWSQFDQTTLKARFPADRTTVRRVRASRRIVHVDVGPVLFDDVYISDLRTGSALWVRAAAFKHVTLAGKIGRLVLSNQCSAFPEAPEQAAFDAAATEFHADVGWALDISKAQFSELDWRLAIPVRLDPETQFFVKRERAVEGAWRKIPLD